MLFCPTENVQIEITRKKFKINLYKSLKWLVIIYTCETWLATKGEGKRRAVLERKFLRRIYKPKKSE